MPARRYWHTSQVERSTMTGTPNQVTWLTLTIPEVEGKRYVALGSATFDTSANTQVFYRLRRAGSAHGVRAFVAYGGAYTVPLLGGPATASGGGDAIWDMWIENVNSATTLGVADAHLLVLELDEADKSNSVGGTVSTTSTTFQTAASLTLSPSTAGDYLVVGSTSAYGDVVNPDCEIRLFDGTNAYALLTPRLASRATSTGRLGYWGAAVMSLPASPTTLSLQYRSGDGSDQITCNARNILALRLDGLPASYVTTSAGPTTTTSSTTLATLSLPTKPSCNALVLGGTLLTCSPDGTNRTAQSTFRKNAAAQTTTAASQSNTDQSWGIARLAAVDGATWTVDLASVGGHVVSAKNTWLAALQLDAQAARGVYIGVMP